MHADNVVTANVNTKRLASSGLAANMPFLLGARHDAFIDCLRRNGPKKPH